MSNKEKLQKAFKNWSTTNKFWQTSDGECFFTEPRAIKHAQKLEDKTAKPYRRADIMEETPEKSTQAVVAATKKAEPKNEASAEKPSTTKKTK